MFHRDPDPGGKDVPECAEMFLNVPESSISREMTKRTHRYTQPDGQSSAVTRLASSDRSLLASVTWPTMFLPLRRSTTYDSPLLLLSR